MDKSLAEAVAKIVDAVHRLYPGINMRPVGSFEDEDFTFEVAVPRNLSVDEVLEACHKECIKVEDEYDLRPRVIIVDEPELGLHPAAISALVGMVKAAAPATQVILATQSSRLVDEFAADQVKVNTICCRSRPCRPRYPHGSVSLS